MFFKTTPLRHYIIRMIMNNEKPYYRNTNISGYASLYVLFFFKRFKSIILNELYYKELIDLHGDIGLFIKAKTASDFRNLNIAASLTAKGKVYYKLYLEEAGPELNLNYKTTTQPAPKLSVVR